MSIQAEAESRTTEIRDRIRPGEHAMSGIVLVHSTCDQMTVVSKQIDWNTYQLSFTSWSDPAITCTKVDVPRPFNVTVFAPALGVRFLATYDALPMPIHITRVFSAALHD